MLSKSLLRPYFRHVLVLHEQRPEGPHERTHVQPQTDKHHDLQHERRRLLALHRVLPLLRELRQALLALQQELGVHGQRDRLHDYLRLPGRHLRDARVGSEPGLNIAHPALHVRLRALIVLSVFDFLVAPAENVHVGL